MNLVSDDITELLKRAEDGDLEAGSQVLAHIYADLRQIARARRRNEHSDTLGTTALVHETWLAIGRNQQASFGSRQHYFAYAAKAMRHILIDHARQRAAGKRQPDLDDQPQCSADSLELIALDQALTRLAALSPRLSRVVELRLFAGLSSREISIALGLTERTIDRDWLKARALLGQWLQAS
jgi:RNA polymerase sigma factor (TIGR02999 family)